MFAQYGNSDVDKKKINEPLQKQKERTHQKKNGVGQRECLQY